MYACNDCDLINFCGSTELTLIEFEKLIEAYQM